MLEIRRATIADLDALLPLVAGYREFYKRPQDAQGERAFMKGHLENGTSTIFVAYLDGAAAGFAQIFHSYSTTRLKPMLILEDLFVAPEARARGIASKLLARACDFSREIGAAGMFLETATDNAAAQSVYERNGWTREAQFYKYNAPSR